MMGTVAYNFQGDRFVVTGASSGMGHEVALSLAKNGAEVLAIARRQEKLEELQAECADRISIAIADVSDVSALGEAIGGFVHKNGKLSGSVHAAGLVGLTPLRSYDSKFAHQIMDANFWGGVNLVQISSKAVM